MKLTVAQPGGTLEVAGISVQEIYQLQPEERLSTILGQKRIPLGNNCKVEAQDQKMIVHVPASGDNKVCPGKLVHQVAAFMGIENREVPPVKLEIAGEMHEINLLQVIQRSPKGCAGMADLGGRPTNLKMLGHLLTAIANRGLTPTDALWTVEAIDRA